MKYNFNCGCSVILLDEKLRHDGLPSLEIPYEEMAIALNYGRYCPEAFKLIGEGKNKGVFQLESYLGHKWGLELQPSNIEELAALSALIRPACLNALVDDKSLTQLFCDRKHKREETTSINDIVDKILEETYGVLCIHEDTMISMHDGDEKPIKNIRVGDKINSIEQTNYSCIPETCEAICISPKTNGVKLTLENGWSIVLTDDHKIYTHRGPIEVHNLLPNDVIQFVKNQTSSPTISQLPYYNETKWSYLCGQLVGDGGAGEVIASGTKKNHDLLFSFLKNNFADKLNIREYFSCRSWYIALSGKELLKDKNYGVRKTIYRRFIEILGLDKTKHNKIIPIEIMNGIPEIRHQFLAGLFDSDGYVGLSTNNQLVIHYCTSNKTVLHQVRKLLSLDGIHSYLDPSECHLHVLDQQKFYQIVSPFIRIKNFTPTFIDKLRSGLHVGSFPKDILKKYVKHNTKLSYKNYCSSMGLSESVLLNNKFAVMSTVAKLGYNLGDIITMKVKKIEPVSNQKFYSISVSGCHNLIGNGIVISNCYQEGAISIASKVAGYSEEQADILRRAVGKKDAALMSSLEKSFINGCAETGVVDSDLAKQLFEWIRESQQYAFNKCLASNTIVKTESGYKYICDVKIGEKVCGPSSMHTYDSYYTIKDKMYNGPKLCNTYTLSNYMQISCTKDHKFLTACKQILPIEEIIKQDYYIRTSRGLAKIIFKSEDFVIDTYDIEIDSKDHIFYGNGIATSNSHAVSYSYISYLCAWTKHHFPLHFYASWLAGARERLEKEKEIRELYAEASSESILIKTPSLHTLLWNNCDVVVDKDFIRFGIQCMKKVGQAEIKKVSTFVEQKQKELGPIDKWSWTTILYHLLPNINSQTAYALITGGVLSNIKLSRSEMLSQYEKVKMITDKQLEKLREWDLPLKDGLIKLVDHVKGAQKQKIQGILSFLQEKSDDPSFIIKEERALYHIPLTFKPSEVIKSTIISNCTCKEFQDGKKFKFNENIVIKGEIQDCRSWKIKNGPNKGKTMCSFNITDDTNGVVSCVVFNDLYEDVFDQLYDTNLVLIAGYRSKTNSLVIKEIQPIY